MPNNFLILRRTSYTGELIITRFAVERGLKPIVRGAMRSRSIGCQENIILTSVFSLDEEYRIRQRLKKR